MSPEPKSPTKPPDPPVKADDADEPELTGKDAVREAGAGKVDGMSDDERSSAVNWFLNDEEDGDDVAIRKFKLDVSAEPGIEKWVVFQVKALPRERIEQIRREARPKVSRRMRDPEDDGTAKANLRIAAEGLLDPDLSNPEMRKGPNGMFADPADALSWRFRRKEGLIDQITAQVISASGYDSDDLEEIEAVKT